MGFDLGGGLAALKGWSILWPTITCVQPWGGNFLVCILSVATYNFVLCLRGGNFLVCILCGANYNFVLYLRGGNFLVCRLLTATYNPAQSWGENVLICMLSVATYNLLLNYERRNLFI